MLLLENFKNKILSTVNAFFILSREIEIIQVIIFSVTLESYSNFSFSSIEINIIVVYCLIGTEFTNFTEREMKD